MQNQEAAHAAAGLRVRPIGSGRRERGESFAIAGVALWSRQNPIASASFGPSSRFLDLDELRQELPASAVLLDRLPLRLDPEAERPLLVRRDPQVADETTTHSAPPNDRSKERAE
ncbi:MAG: hypothetical protein K0Q60_2584 [Microvirga sp.]|jgi:hypothetical protein|nr:hypothetical protein [Microvirga sp.]